MLGRDAESLVAHPDPGLVDDERRADLDAATLWGVVDRVLQEVPDDLREPVAATADDGRLVCRLEAKLMRLALRPGLAIDHECLQAVGCRDHLLRVPRFDRVGAAG